MKLFYFGSIRSNESFNETVINSKVKPSASAQNFEYALINGISANKSIDLTIASAESIAMFPGGNRLFLKRRQDVLNDTAVANVIPAINLPYLKQENHARGAAKLLKKWLCENKNEKDKCVLVYGLYPMVVKQLQKVCKKYDCKIFDVLTDLPSTMFANDKNKSLKKKFFSLVYRKTGTAVQGNFDGYVYLTEAMKDEVAPDKPYIVIETIVDTTIFDEIEQTNKSVPPAIMYAGELKEEFGLKRIMDVFENLKNNCELWLFGSGDYEAEIIKRASLNSKIKFFGRVTRDEVLKREKEATLLINLRSANSEFTKHSFPSKMIEYMLSGTPLFTTKLPGIPDEYNEYCYMTTVDDPKVIANQVDRILSEENTAAMGTKAKNFVAEHKNYYVQSNKIVKFLEEQTR